MTKPAYRNGKDPAKKRADENLGKSRGNHRWFVPVLAELRLILPKTKFAQELAVLTNRDPRVCEDWIATPPRGAPGGSALAALLTGPHGKRLIKALAKSSPHAWGAEIVREIERSEVRAEIRAGQKRLAALDRDDF